MKPAKFVLRYYLSAYCEGNPEDGYDIWKQSPREQVIGSGTTSEKAWEDAKDRIKELPKDQKPKIK